MALRPGLANIDLHLVKVLFTVISERSVSRAAMRLQSTQPMVSAQLKRLRELTGDPLLVRSGQGLAPTDAALAMLEPATRLLREAETLFSPQQRSGPFDPAKVGVQAIGDIVIEPRTGGRIYVGYKAEGVHVDKVVERQTFSQPDVGGTFHGAFRLRQASTAGGLPWGTREFTGEVLAYLDGRDVFLRIEEPSSRCEFRGTRTPSGRYATLSGQYTCVGGEAGTFEITDFEVTQHAISGYLRARTPSNQPFGRFGAAPFSPAGPGIEETGRQS